MDAEAKRRQLRATFNEDALLYDQVRPGYPAALFDDVVALSGIPRAGRVIEVGTGTGQATLPFAQRGYHILAIELGAGLAAVARHNLADYPQVEVQVGAFEDWPITAGAFDLLISATAFHWIDPAVRYQKAAQALKAGGTIALFWNEHVWSATSPGFFTEAQAVYERETPEIAEPGVQLLHPDVFTKPIKDEIDASGLFGAVTVRKYVWEQEYDAKSYINVLNTYSGHRNLPDDKRERLFHGIATLIDEQYGGRISKGYLTLLYLARRLT